MRVKLSWDEFVVAGQTQVSRQLGKNIRVGSHDLAFGRLSTDGEETCLQLPHFVYLEIEEETPTQSSSVSSSGLKGLSAAESAQGLKRC